MTIVRKFFSSIIYLLKDLDDGLDYYTFRNGIYQVFVQSEELAIRIFNTIDFNYSGSLKCFRKPLKKI